MPLPAPNLDDRTFGQLMEEARLQIQRSSPAWTDLSPGDPGIVLLELFAFLTETMLYRLNRLPDKAYVEFLNLLGVRLYPPAAASVTLRFSRRGDNESALDIPRSARVTTNRTDAAGEAPVFTTAHSVTLAPGESSVDAPAYQCDLVEGELAGVGTGLPGLVVTARRPPIVAPTGDDLDLVVGVETAREELEERAPAVQYGDKAYRVWRSVDSFTNLGSDRYAYRVDRLSGQILFAPAARIALPGGGLADTPAALAEIPPAGREIRLWYRRGGGAGGNVAAGTLTVLKDTLPGIEVTNPEPATGGQAAETLENALVRGPLELHSLERAITARDFENVALYSSRAVARARAVTRADLWMHARPGTVEVLLVPFLPETQRVAGQVTAAALLAQQTEAVRTQIERDLNSRRPLGTACVVTWTRYKPVSVAARIVVRRQEDRARVKQRVLERLHGTINPLPTEYSPGGWRFGQALRVSHVYDVALAEPGVLWVDRVQLRVDDVPQKNATAVTADYFQAGAWYAAGGPALYRSLNQGDGWEPVAHFEGERLQVIRAHPERAGVLAAITTAAAGRATIYFSADCGESWEPSPTYTAFEINDAAWTLRDGTPVLLLATDVGLYELPYQPGASPVQVLVDPQTQNLGFYAVVASRDVRGQVSVAVAAQGTRGVFLSSSAGQRNTFRLIGLRGEDIRVLTVQYDGPRAFLWAGAAAAGPDDPGKGCFRWELLGAQDPPDGWRPLSAGWSGGSCRALTFLGARALAASFRSGVLRLNTGDRDPRWETPDVRCGLPLRDPGRFSPVDAVAAGANAAWAMAGASDGLFRSADGGLTYERAAQTEFADQDRVTLPPTWLFCSGEHQIEVVSEDEAERA